MLQQVFFIVGFAKRFGIVHFVYDSQVRTIKDSGLEFARIANELLQNAP